jgi:hypothetical protein
VVRRKQPAEDAGVPAACGVEGLFHRLFFLGCVVAAGFSLRIRYMIPFNTSSNVYPIAPL